MYLSVIPLPAGFELGNGKQVLQGHFSLKYEDARPYLYRLSIDRRYAAVLCSEPASQISVKIEIEEGVKYRFDLRFRRTVKDRDGREMTIMDRERLSEIVSDWALANGAMRIDVEISELRREELFAASVLRGRATKHRPPLPVADVCGTVTIADADLFSAAMLQGGPKTGKAYGCGLWWLHEIMNPAIKECLQNGI